MELQLNGVTLQVKEGDFPLQPHAEYFNLKIYPDVGRCERIVGLLADVIEDMYPGSTVGVVGWRRGGFIPIFCRRRGLVVQVYPGAGQKAEDVPAEFRPPPPLRRTAPSVVFIEEGDGAASESVRLALSSKPLLITASSVDASMGYAQRLRLTDSPFTVWLQRHHIPLFRGAFHYYMDEAARREQDSEAFAYDNLIHLVIMVKNAGPGFEQVLKNNLPVIDRWTVLDTGSTDGTQDVVRKVLEGKKKGALYEEPFINFRESRNRSLELAGTRCKFALILDDTYWVKGPLRSFLNLVRGDQFSTSFSGMIASGDSEYYSNRVIKTEAGLRYMYTIHEVIQDEGNTNVVIPKDQCILVDECSDYMEGRTKGRKTRDIELLEGMLKEDPDNPRHLYYLAQTYKCLENWEKAAEYFEKRIAFPVQGFLQEKVDACFELARLYNFTMKKPWPICKALYEKSFELEPSRPDALYFIGIHYLMEEKDEATAFRYFKQAIAIGYPIHTQYSLKPTLYYHFLPKFLVPMCYKFEEFALGEATAKLFLENNKPTEDSYELIGNWRGIFQHLLKAEAELKAAQDAGSAAGGSKPLLVFVADGGFNPWTGRDILSKGVGGSETYIIEMARHIRAAARWRVTVICNCQQPDTFEGVVYVPLEQCYSYLARNEVAACVVSRFSEYIPACLRLPSIANVFMVLHDLGPSGNIIPVHPKLRGVFCLTEWHVKYFLERFPQMADRTHPFGYGINRDVFDRLRAAAQPPAKVPRRFIYSSFPNRGLLQLLQMWPRIQAKYPDATLHVYADLNNAWVNRVAPEVVAAVRAQLAALWREGAAVKMHGWVSKETLARAWLEAEVWLYPCTFQETYCLTAMEAAVSRTLAVTNDLAALQNTVGERGVMVPGDAAEPAWQERCLATLFSLLEDPQKKAELLAKNEAWAAKNSWAARAAEMEARFLAPLLPSQEAKLPGPFKMDPKRHKNVRPELNYADMYNWTNDLPENTRHLFEAALRQAVAGKATPRILEIGTYAGTSTVEMLLQVPNAVATTIDRWEDYNEFGDPVLGEIGERKIMNIFYENLAAAKVGHRVRTLRGDSGEKLIGLLQEGAKFEFIYVDGSHKCLDCYADMVLSWPLLVRGGIMAVDDVLFRAEKATEGREPLEVPYLGVDHFVQKYKGQFEIVHSGYRIYLQKK